MALWTAKFIQNNRLFSTEFESISRFGSDALTEAKGRLELMTFSCSKSPRATEVEISVTVDVVSHSRLLKPQNIV